MTHRELLHGGGFCMRGSSRLGMRCQIPDAENDGTDELHDRRSDWGKLSGGSV